MKLTIRTLTLLLLGWFACSADGQTPSESLPPRSFQRLGTSKLRHGSRILCLAYSPDAQVLAAGGGNDPVRLWNPEDGRAAPRDQRDVGANDGLHVQRRDAAVRGVPQNSAAVEHQAEQRDGQTRRPQGRSQGDRGLGGHVGHRHRKSGRCDLCVGLEHAQKARRSDGPRRRNHGARVLARCQPARLGRQRSVDFPLGHHNQQVQTQARRPLRRSRHRLLRRRQHALHRRR